MESALDKLLALIDKLLTFFSGLTIGHGLADKTRREIQVKLEAKDLEAALLKNELEVEKEYSNLTDDDIIRKHLGRRSKRDH